jgi:hypothetical protein
VQPQRQTAEKRHSPTANAAAVGAYTSATVDAFQNVSPDSRMAAAPMPPASDDMSSRTKRYTAQAAVAPVSAESSVTRKATSPSGRSVASLPRRHQSGKPVSWATPRVYAAVASSPESRRYSPGARNAARKAKPTRNTTRPTLAVYPAALD